MPYRNNSDLPTPVRDNLPARAQTIFRKAFNNAYREYQDPKKRTGSLEETCNKVAWSAVKHVYKKVGDQWVKQ